MASFYGGGSDVDDADEELTYWEEKYGGGTDGSSSSSAYGGGPPPSVLDGSAFLPSYNDTDKGVLVLYNMILLLLCPKVESQQKYTASITNTAVDSTSSNTEKVTTL